MVERRTAAARAHAAAAGLAITYEVGAGEALPFADGRFDIAYCCDVLEHVADLDAVITEIARVLVPGGLFFYDTINRTLRSKVVIIKLLQEWRATRIFDFTLHEWDKFIRPPELLALLQRHGLGNRALIGLSPRTPHPLALLTALRRLRHGAPDYVALGRLLQAAPSRDLSLSYMGYAVKR